MSDDTIVKLVDGHMRQLFLQPPVVQPPPAMLLPPLPVPVAPAPVPSAQLPSLPPPEPLPQGSLLVPQGPLSRYGPGNDAGGAVNRQQAYRGRGRERCEDSGVGGGVFGGETLLGRVGRSSIDQPAGIRAGENCFGLGVGGGIARASVSVPGYYACWCSCTNCPGG